MDRAQRGDRFGADPGAAGRRHARRLGAKTAMVVGAGQAAVGETVNLSGKEDVWKFQLALLAQWGRSATTW